MLLARAPEVIIEVRATGLIAAEATSEDRKAWSALGSIPAIRSGRVYFLSGDHMLVPGPRVAQGVESFARALHPEVFR
jgi:ABC-type Fe3+-hydroxamate transport system substrate-binding protein